MRKGERYSESGRERERAHLALCDLARQLEAERREHRPRRARRPVDGIMCVGGMHASDADWPRRQTWKRRANVR